jgi:hypothetical protein
MAQKRKSPLVRETWKFIEIIEELIIDGHLDRVPDYEAKRFDRALNRLRSALDAEEAVR